MTHRRHPAGHRLSWDDNEAACFRSGVTWVGGAIVIVCFGLLALGMIVDLLRKNPVALLVSLAFFLICAAFASWFALVRGRKALQDVIRQKRLLRRVGINPDTDAPAPGLPRRSSFR